MVTLLGTNTIQTLFGTFQESLFYDGQRETIALVMGDVSQKESVLCRVHSSCLYGHAFNSVECDCREQMAISQQLIEQDGCGIIIWMEQEGKGNGHFALLKSAEYKQQGLAQGAAYEAAGFKKDARDFRAAAEILQYLKVASIRMLTNNADKIETLTKWGVRVVGIAPVEL